MPEIYAKLRDTASLRVSAAFGLSIAAIALASPSGAADMRYDPGDKIYFTYCYAHPPAMRIKPGDSVTTNTRDASNDAFTVSDKTLAPKLDLTKVNPQTGPFYIEGAEPGDTLVVHIDSIDLNRDWGWGGSIPYFGLLAPEYKTSMVTPPVPDHLFIWHLDKNRKVATLDMPNSKIGKVEVPIRPFFGTIGTAPAGKQCISSLDPGSHGANMDFNEVVAGVTLHFPVFEPGALFMLGDGHAAQGDGEIDGAAIETSFNVKFTVNLIKGKKINWPHLINDNEIMSIGSTRPLIDALRIGCKDMVDWLMEDYGFDRYDALHLLGQAAHLYISNVVDPQFSVACALNKKYLPK
jgi:acetamidase/formamidase